MALRDRAPESDFRGYFSETETKLDEGNTAISRHFERGPLWYALETDWLAEARGFELLHFEIRSAAVDYGLRLSLGIRSGTPKVN